MIRTEGRRMDLLLVMTYKNGHSVLLYVIVGHN